MAKNKPVLVTDISKAFLAEKVYYWNCRLDGKTSLLAGPFATPELAEASADCVSPVCVNYRPETARATFGVVEVNAPGCGPGVYNEILPTQLKGELLAAIKQTH